MNKARRTQVEKELAAVRDAMDAMRIALQNLQDLAAEEQDCFDNMPEGLQASENGQRIEEIAQSFESANSTFESAIDEVESALEEISEAVNQ